MSTVSWHQYWCQLITNPHISWALSWNQLTPTRGTVAWNVCNAKPIKCVRLRLQCKSSPGSEASYWLYVPAHSYPVNWANEQSGSPSCRRNRKSPSPEQISIWSLWETIKLILNLEPLGHFSALLHLLLSMSVAAVTVAVLSSLEEVCLVELGQRTLWLVPSPLVLQFPWEVRAPFSPQLQYNNIQWWESSWKFVDIGPLSTLHWHLNFYYITLYLILSSCHSSNVCMVFA